MLEELALNRGDGRFLKLIHTLSRLDVSVRDDWTLTRLTNTKQGNLLEQLDDRHRTRSTIATSQIPVAHWHETMANPTLADAILNRLVHKAQHTTLQGESK